MKAKGSCLGVHQFTLVDCSPRRIAAFPSDDFRARLAATPWHKLTLEQLDVIEDDARLSAIADEVLRASLDGVFSAEEEA